MSTPPVQDFQHANQRVQIHIDLNPINPLVDFDTAVTLAYWGNRYTFGNKHIQRQTKEELLESQQHDPILAILPLYAYVHGESSVSTSPYSCPWDSGQAGWAYITQSGADLMGYQGYSVCQLEEIIKSEVKTFDAYLSGQVFGYQILDSSLEVLDDCWGYFSLEDCVSEAKSAAERIQSSFVNPTMDQFLALNTHSNSYVSEPGFRELYVRKGFRYLDGKRVECVDLARIEAEDPGAGAFTKLAERLLTKYTVYVESVLNPRFAKKLLREGWTMVGGTECPSFYLYRNKHEEGSKSSSL